MKSLTLRKKLDIPEPNFDYVRNATLFLCSEEIERNNVKGSVAELGVFQGEFAKRLNYLFRDRKLFLFDTFEGFSKQDVVTEVTNGYSFGNQNFANTSIELVKSKMTYPDNCVFKKGWFPQTTEGVEDVFCFVSLDADLYEPIYEGLKFFYPRLEKYGYIFIHDFNNENYKGARQAVIKFCTEQQISYVPIVDSGGTVVITK
jgi:O-methyltransferase